VTYPHGIVTGRNLRHRTRTRRTRGPHIRSVTRTSRCYTYPSSIFEDIDHSRSRPRSFATTLTRLNYRTEYVSAAAGGLSGREGDVLVFRVRGECGHGLDTGDAAGI